MRSIRVAVAIGLVAAVAGCGASGRGAEPLAAEDALVLTRLLGEARAAGVENDPDGTRAALREFRSEVTELERRGGIDPIDADALRAGARQAEASVEEDVRSPPAKPEPEQEEPPAPFEEPPSEEPEEKEEDDDEDKDKDKDKDKDEEKGKDG
jgi:hypothetical protein